MVRVSSHRPPTIVAVDIDGVVNALPTTDDDLAHFERWQRRRVLGYPLTVAEEVVDWLTSLDERGGQFHWATTWTPNRHVLEEVFGLPGDAPVAADPNARIPRDASGLSWKAAQVTDLVARTRRPLVWMDDDAITEPTVAALDDLSDRLALPMLAVATHLATGVLPDQMARVDDFLAAVVEGTAEPGLSVDRG